MGNTQKQPRVATVSSNTGQMWPVGRVGWVSGASGRFLHGDNDETTIVRISGAIRVFDMAERNA